MMDKIEYFTKNRKLKIEEYDDNGNLIDTIEFSDVELWNFCLDKVNSYQSFDIMIKYDREYFKGEKKKLFYSIAIALNYHLGFITIKEVKEIDRLFEKYSLEQLRFASKFKDYLSEEVYLYEFSHKEKSYFDNKKLIDILEWTNNTSGFWYSVGDNGRVGRGYLNKPTKHQARYQRTKYGKKIVYLSFKDWKEYLINESELA